MTQANIELLLKDLCARQAYGLKVLYDGEVKEIQYIEPLYNEVKLLDPGINYTVLISDIKPYLRPMDSMTGEERIKYGRYCINETINNKHFMIPTVEGFDWLLKNHFDFRGLIPKALALPALEGMYNN